VVLSSCTVLFALAFAGPASIDAPDGNRHTVGVVWDDEATGSSKIQQRVVDTLAETPAQRGAGQVETRTVVNMADQRARVAVGVELPRARADHVVRLGQGLADATTRFREGDLPAADSAAQGVLAALDADPLLPGAAALAFAAHMLRVQVAWTAGDDVLARSLAHQAVVLDPEAVLSTRQFPPAVVALHEEVRASIVAARDTWTPIDINVDPRTGPVTVEVDGRPGRRRVPSGRHCVVVRRPGRAPVGFWTEPGSPVVVPSSPELIPAGLPQDATAADIICDRAGVDMLIFAEVRAGRMAMEGYVCGEGYGRTWFSEPYAPVASSPGPTDSELTDGVAWVLDLSEVTHTGSRLIGRERWPKPKPKPTKVVRRDNPPPPPPTKPWFRRAWVWSVIGGVVVAGVTTGAVLGTREQPAEIVVDADTFLPSDSAD